VAGDRLATVSADHHERQRGGSQTCGNAAADRGSGDGSPDPEPTRSIRLPVALRRHGPDVLVAVVLFALGLVARHRTLPRDGLIFDDAWVAIGAMKASVGDLLAVGEHHPGFTAVLMGWARFVPSRAESLALPVYVVGAATAPVLFLALGRFSVWRPVRLLVAALIVVAPAHVYYSGRVKTYIVEGLIVLVLAVLLPFLAGRRWSWSTVVLWVGAAALVGTMGAFAFVAVGAATAILALHPMGDGARRWAALGAQALIQLPYLVIVEASFDSGEVADHLEREYDAYIEIAAPGSMVRQIGAHLARLGEAIIVGGRPLTLGVTLFALAALAWEAWRGPRSVVARYLLLLPALAFGGSLVGKVPFGPTWGNPVFPGTRATLWLVPSLAVGLAFGLDHIAALLRRIVPSMVLPLSVAVILVTGVVLARKLDDGYLYLDSGARSAHDFVEQKDGDRDVIVVLPNATWHYAAVPGVSVDIQSTPERDIGFQPRLLDARIWVQTESSGWDGSTAQLRRRLGAAPRVFILDGLVGYGDQMVPALETSLASLGYTRRPGLEASAFKVSLWERPQP
jgi:hypothetical protein